MYACTVLVQVLATPHKWCWWQWTSVIQLGVGVSEMISGVPQAPYRMYWHSIPKIRIHKLGLFECLPLSQHSKDPQFSHQSCHSGNRIVAHYTFTFNTAYCVFYFREYQSFPTSTSIVCLVGCVRWKPSLEWPFSASKFVQTVMGHPSVQAWGRGLLCVKSIMRLVHS